MRGKRKGGSSDAPRVAEKLLEVRDEGGSADFTGAVDGGEQVLVHHVREEKLPEGEHRSGEGESEAWHERRVRPALRAELGKKK